MSDAPDRVPDEVLDDLRRRLRDRRRVPVVGTGWAARVTRGVPRRPAAVLGGGVRLARGGGPDPGAAVDPRRRPAARPPAGGRRRRTGARAAARLAGLGAPLPAGPAAAAGRARRGPRAARLPLLRLPRTAGALMAEPIAAATAELGHDRYVVSGGDIGTGVAEALARLVPEHVSALHLTDVPSGRRARPPRRSARTASGRSRRRCAAGPRRRAPTCTSSPRSPRRSRSARRLPRGPRRLDRREAAVVERLRRRRRARVPRDDLLTWITLYWVTGAIGTSFAPYAERLPPVQERVAGAARGDAVPQDLLHAPRELAERTFDVRTWDEQPSAATSPPGSGRRRSSPRSAPRSLSGDAPTRPPDPPGCAAAPPEAPVASSGTRSEVPAVREATMTDADHYDLAVIGAGPPARRPRCAPRSWARGPSCSSRGGSAGRA